ncbi:MAG: hypothetical protein ABSC22_04325, partial [Roseiarcus sp.]
MRQAAHPIEARNAMYLKTIYAENNGPIQRLNFKLPFTPAGDPKPVVLVGANGSGKTNVLSIIVEALFQAAAVCYSDALMGQS